MSLRLLLFQKKQCESISGRVSRRNKKQQFRGKIEAPANPPTNSRISAGEPEDEKNISFSFKYLKTKHRKFKYSKRPWKYYCTLIERLHAYCSKTESELRTKATHYSKCKKHADWSLTTMPNGFDNLPPQLDDLDAYELSTGSKGRMHGVFLRGVFYMVWLDPDHLLYPRK